MTFASAHGRPGPLRTAGPDGHDRRSRTLLGPTLARPVGERISIFTSERGWWRRGLTPEDTVRDGVDREQSFSAGRATLLSTGDGTVTAVARGGRRGSAHDFEDRVAFDRVRPTDPVPVEELAAAVRARSRAAAATILHSGFGLLSEAASADIRAWLRAHYPGASAALEEALSPEPAWMADALDAAELYRMERDAVNVALEVAGLDRAAALAGHAPPAAPSHFLADTLVRPDEDSAVIDDLDLFPGWEPIARLRPAGRVFEDAASGRRLTVLHANRNQIEHTTGVDLVYFVHDYRSFVLVQYKRVRRDGRAEVVRVDARADEQRDRMTALESAFRGAGPVCAKSLDEHRLADAMCFFKLCEAEQPVEASDLCRGKYVDLRTWELMDAAGALSGPRGGRRLAYGSVARYLTNSTFAELVAEGWVGSATAKFDEIVQYIFDRYDSGGAVILGALRLGRSYRRTPSRGQDVGVKVVVPAR
jgi:hypothetical protein